MSATSNQNDNIYTLYIIYTCHDSCNSFCNVNAFIILNILQILWPIVRYQSSCRQIYRPSIFKLFAPYLGSSLLMALVHLYVHLILVALRWIEHQRKVWVGYQRSVIWSKLLMGNYCQLVLQIYFGKSGILYHGQIQGKLHWNRLT